MYFRFQFIIMSFLSYAFSAEVAETEDKEFCAWEWEKKKALFANGQNYLSELPGNTIIDGPFIVCPYVPVCIRSLSLI